MFGSNYLSSNCDFVLTKSLIVIVIQIGHLSQGLIILVIQFYEICNCFVKLIQVTASNQFCDEINFGVDYNCMFLRFRACEKYWTLLGTFTHCIMRSFNLFLRACLEQISLARFISKSLFCFKHLGEWKLLELVSCFKYQLRQIEPNILSRLFCMIHEYETELEPL